MPTLPCGTLVTGNELDSVTRIEPHASKLAKERERALNPYILYDPYSPRLCSEGERAKGRQACDSWRLLEQQTGERAYIEPEQEQRRQPEQQHRLPSGPVRPHGKLPVPELVCSWTGRVRQRVSMSLFPGLPPDGESRIESLG